MLLCMMILQVIFLVVQGGVTSSVPFDLFIEVRFLGLCALARVLTYEPLIGLLGLGYLVYAFEKFLQNNPSFSLKTEANTDVINVTAKSERIVNHKPVNWIDYLGVEYYRRFFSVPIEGKFIQNLSGQDRK